MSIVSSQHIYDSLYKGLGRGTNVSDSLPPQAISSKKKNNKWKKANMDRLEEIGLKQITKNFIFNDFYAMVEGDLSFLEYGETPDILKGVQATTEKLNLPHYVKHFDIIGRIANYLSTKYNNTKGKFRLDFMDPIAENEYERELNNRIFGFVKSMVGLEMKSQLIRHNLLPKEEFKNEEEARRYMQFLQQEKNKLDTPPEIKTAMDTEWKPEAAIYMENVLERDNRKYRTNSQDNKRFLDKFLTGRYFDHYNISYDYYEIERWDPRETFFSEDPDIKHPQDCEYIGNVQDMAPSKIVDMFGHLMKQKDIEQIINHFDYKSSGDSGLSGARDIIENNFHGEEEIIPSENYYDRKSSLELQGELGVPLQETSYIDADGNEVTHPSFIQPYEFDTEQITGFSKNLRRDITGRDDTLRVTRAYWRSWKKVAYLYYETDMGYPVYELITDDILDGFLKEKGIKKLKELSLQSFLNKMESGTIESNSIVFTYAPIVYKGIKINASETILKKDIYLDVRPLDFQIKGKSNIYRVKLPVSGIISTAPAKKMLPYQREHNYQMNMMRSLTEKELGMVWMFDVQMLPSDWKGMGDSKDILSNVVDMARDIGIIPLDTTRQNLQNRNPQSPGMDVQNITFVPQIQQKMQLAEYYKNLALEQIGITTQDLKTPSEYSTAEGIKQGVVNTHSQIEHIFDEMDTARMKGMEVNMSVAQYCKTHGKDRQMSFVSSTTGNIVMNTLGKDLDFDLRKFGLVPMMDSEGRRQLEEFKRFILSNNTLSDDTYSLARVLTSDSFQVAKKALLESKKDREKEIINARKHEQKMKVMEQKYSEKETLEQRKFELFKQQRDNENSLNVARIQNSENFKVDVDEENDALEYEKMLKNKLENRKLDIKEKDSENKDELEKKKLEIKEEELEEKKRSNDLKEREIKTKRFTSIINKN